MIDYILLEKYGKQISVLFVEDDEDLLKEMGFLLKDIFNNVNIAIDGDDAFSKYTNYFDKYSNYYDLVITDIQMPKVSGIDLIKNIYKINPEQKIIVLSAHSEKHYLMELLNIGIAQFILKPIDYDSFLDIIFDISKKIYEDKYQKNISKLIFIKLADKLFWNKEKKQLILNEKIIKLTKKEFLLIDLLMKYPEKVYTYEEIRNHLWFEENSLEAEISNLKNLISRLRKKVPTLDIQNNYGFGYSIKILK